MRRKRLSILLLMLSALLPIWPFWQVLQPVPAAIHAAQGRGTVEFSVDDVTLLMPGDCLTAHWQVEQIKAVELNGEGVAGQGAQTVCAPAADLTVTFQDGAQKTYTLAAQFLPDSPVSRLLLLAALAVFASSVLVSGLLAALWRPIRHRASERIPPLSTRRPGARRPAVLLALVGILLIGAALRTHFLSKTLGADESWTVNDFALESWPEIMSDYQSTNNHIFHSLLVHESIALFGLERWTIRLPAYFAGIMGIAAAFAVGSRFYNAYAGLLAAAITAGSDWLIGYSVNARGYTLIVLIFLLLLLLAFRLLKRRRLRLWLAFALLSVIGLYTIPSMAYAIGPVVVWLGLSVLLEKRGRDRVLWLRDLLLTALLIAITAGALYLPAWRNVQASTSANLDVGSFAPIDRAEAALIAGDVAREFWESVNAPWTALVPVFVLAVLTAAVFHSRLSGYRVSLIAALALWVPAAVLLPALVTYPRVWIFLAPLYYVTASAGFIYILWLLLPYRLVRRPRVVSAAILILSAAIAFFYLQQVPFETVGGHSRFSAEEGILRVRSASQSGDYAICDWFCSSYALEAKINHLPFLMPVLHSDQLSSETSFTLLAGHHLYFVTRDLNPLSGKQLEKALQQMDIPPALLTEADVFASLSDSTIYRLRFSQTFSAPAGEP